MNTRRDGSLEQQRHQLAERIQAQRLQLRTRSLALRNSLPGLRPGKPWQRPALVAGAAIAVATVLVLSRTGPAARIASVLRLASLGARCWVVARVGLQLARNWRAAPRADGAVRTRTP